MNTPTAAAADAQVALAAGERLRRRHLLVVAILVGGLLLAATAGMSIGSVHVGFGRVWSIVWSHVSGGERGGDRGEDTIIWEIRFPRVVLGTIVGGGLSLIGVAVQAMVRNPLADPYVLGVESGASAGAVAVIYLGRGAVDTGIVTPAVGAFAGAIVTLLLVFALARSGGRVSSIRLLLVGVALSYALSGVTSFVLYSTRDPSAQSAILFWILGGLGAAQWAKLPIVAVCVALGGAYIWFHARRLNALAVGDDAALALGVNPDRLRIRMFVVSSIVVATMVSVAGPIGFVGLVVPHVARMLVGADHRRLLPAAILLGAAYLIVVDIVARWMFSPSEIPIGVVTAILGTPFFLWLIRRRGAAALRDSS